MSLNEIKGYIGSASNPEAILQKLLELGGHNNLHITPDNPNKIYYLLPNKTISCKLVSDDSKHVTPPARDAFNAYATNGIVFYAYNYDDNTVWNPYLGFIHIYKNHRIRKLPASESAIHELCQYARKIGYVYIPKADVWKFNMAPKSPCYYKHSSTDMFWSVGVFLGYDENGSAVIDRGTDITTTCWADYCVPYKKFKTLVNKSGQINDKLVNVQPI